MVSFQPVTLSSNKRKITTELQDSSKKRKQEDDQTKPTGRNTLLNNQTRSNTRSMFDFKLRLQAPLPSVKQLDIKTRRTQEPPSLDLALNLVPLGSPRKQNMKDHRSLNLYGSASSSGHVINNSSEKIIGLSRSPSWLAFDDDDDDDRNMNQEMVATVCMKCNMLVMLCKSSPVCPNCKFMHPHDHHGALKIFKPSSTLSLLC